MASPGDEGLPIHQPIEISSGSESGSVPTDDDQSSDHSNICPWRTSRYNEDECSLYFDCPTHMVERAVSDTDEGTSRRDETSRISDTRADDTDSLPYGEVPGVQAETPPVPGSETTPAVEIASHPLTNEQQGGPSGTAENPVVLDGDTPSPSQSQTHQENSPVVIDDTPQTRLEDVTGGGVLERGGGGASLPSPGLRTETRSRPTIPARVHPLNTIPTSPRNPAPASPRSLTLPRWQPDAEVTYCPICGTQFSIFIRKHHCR